MTPTGLRLWELKNSIIFMPITPYRGLIYVNHSFNENLLDFEFLKRLSLYNLKDCIYSDRKSKEAEDLFMRLRNDLEEFRKKNV